MSSSTGTVIFEDATLQAEELVANTVTLNNFSVSSTTSLQQATNVSNVTTNTVRFTNPTTAFVTTGNVGIANTSPLHTLSVGSNLYVNDTSSNVLTVEGALKARVGLFDSKPAFMVKNDSTVSVTSETTFTTEFDDVYVNVGGHYDTTTGKFTAPYEGTYIFYFSGLHVDGTNSGKVGLTFLKNGTNVMEQNAVAGSNGTSGIGWNTVGNASSTNDEDYVTAIWMGVLQVGDEIQARVNYINSVTAFFYGHNHGHFAGYLI